MKILEEIDGDELKLYFSGIIDLYSAINVKEAFRLIHRTDIRRCKVDMTDVKFVDSSGLAALLAGSSIAVDENVELYFINAQPQIKDLVTLTKLDTMIRFKDTV